MNQEKKQETLAPSQPMALGVLTAIQQREIAEVQSKIIIARSNPRDRERAKERILDECRSVTFADKALFAYSRGGTDISGESIRLAEMIAQHWGNIDWGVRELDQRDGVSDVEAYAWDLESNVVQRRTYRVKHERKARGQIYRLEDPRDIYEMVANSGARRMRACLLAIIPDDVKDDAKALCEKTLSESIEITDKLIASMIEKFSKLGVTKDRLEAKIQRKIEKITPQQVINLKKIFNSITDGMSAPGDWFDMELPEKDGKKISMKDVKKKDEKKDQEPEKKDDASKISAKAINKLVTEAQKRNIEQGDLMKIVKLFGFNSLEEITDPPYDEILVTVKNQ